VVLHIDSPGGSALASDLIWREVARLRRKKPVVAWFGAVAASGGYYAACAANAIVAQPATLTGSIGVIVAKGVLSGLYDRLGVHRERIERGRMAGMFTSDRPFDDLERERMQALVQRSYDRFKQRVAEGRSMDPDEVERLARGRVYAARQVAGGTLVDALGDMQAAIARAKALAGLDGARDVAVVQVNPPRQRMAAPDEAAAALAELPDALAALAREHTLALLPFDLHFC
jgi:protease-4